ncbi:hypothetical protein [Psychrobacillus sp. L3]|uniref:hypothetical protein n=1 Tax=Psychrobacillus sp. L3 TaxID=3236891 RepID=UPI0036F1BBE9
MFGFLKLSGAPTMAYRYYRSTKDKNEKAILEDLYKSYNKFVKENEKISTRYPGNSEEHKFLILSGTFDDLYSYGITKGYQEEIIFLFRQV